MIAEHLPALQVVLPLLSAPFCVAFRNGTIAWIILEDQKQVVKRHDGSDAPALKDRPRKGHIGFQNLSRGGSPVFIRKARIRVIQPE